MKSLLLLLFITTFLSYSQTEITDSNLAAVYNNRGLSKSDLKDYNGAIADYAKVIELKPNRCTAKKHRTTI